MITCTAEITNIIDTVGISGDMRLSAASNANKAQTGYAAIGANMDAASLIHLKAGDTLRIKGASLPTANDGNSVGAKYSATATLVTTAYIHNGGTWDGLSFASSGGYCHDNGKWRALHPRIADLYRFVGSYCNIK